MTGRTGWLAPAALLAASCVGCTPDLKYQPDVMWDDSRLRPLEGGPLPGSASSARPLPPGAVPRGETYTEGVFSTGRQGEALVRTIPMRVTPQLLQHGQEEFNTFCSPCHGLVGDGRGMVVRRGFPEPPDYAIPRLREAPAGHFFDVITNGYGVMYSYAGRVPVPDRWAITAYIRLLQERRPVVPPEVGDPRRTRTEEPSRPPRTPAGR